MNRSNVLAVLLLLCGLQACDRTATSLPTSAPVGEQAAIPAQGTGNPADTIVAAQAEIDRIVSEVMRQQYGDGYDDKHKCWLHALENNDGATQYCMRARPARVVDVKGGRELHFIATSAVDINDDPRFAYSAVDSGLMGAYQVSLSADGSWKSLAAEKAMSFGTAGVCGCEDAVFTKLGKGYYGWIFTSGGMWQGVIVSNHEIVAPRNGGFKNLSAIPEIREEAQSIRYSIKVLEGGNEQQDMFPLRVEKTQSDKKVGEKIVEFDRNKWMYSEVGDL